MQITENSAYDVPNGSLRADGDDYTKSGRRGSGVAWYLSGMVTSVYSPPAACLAPTAAKTARKAIPMQTRSGRCSSPRPTRPTRRAASRARAKYPHETSALRATSQELSRAVRSAGGGRICCGCGFVAAPRMAV